MRLSAQDLQSYLHDRIPLTVPMGVRVDKLGPGSVRLVAPFDINRNHKSTAFGGSLATLATLAGWGLLHCELTARGMSTEIVIQKSTLLYARPVTGDIYAYCDRPDESDWKRFLSALERRGKGRISLTSWISAPDNAAMTMEGRFVAKLSEEEA